MEAHEEISSKSEKKETFLRSFLRKFSMRISNMISFLRYYLRKYSMWISILISFFTILNVTAIFLTANYSFKEIFLYFGILMILLGSGTLAFVYYCANYFWALVTAICLGLVPAIEITVNMILVNMNTTSHVLAIVSLLLTLVMIILPFILVYAKNTKKQ